MRELSNFEKLLLKARRQNAKNARRQGRKEERREIIFQVVKQMLKNGVNDEDIMYYMDITKEELEKLKLKIV